MGNEAQKRRIKALLPIFVPHMVHCPDLGRHAASCRRGIMRKGETRPPCRLVHVHPRLCSQWRAARTTCSQGVRAWAARRADDGQVRQAQMRPRPAPVHLFSFSPLVIDTGCLHGGWLIAQVARTSGVQHARALDGLAYTTRLGR